MSVQLKLKTMEIYAAYVKLREIGVSMEDSIRQLHPDVVHLPDPGREKLNRMIRDWEQEHLDDTIFRPQPPAERPERKEAPLPKGIQPLRADATVACPACGRLNRKGGSICTKCGYDLTTSTPFGTQKLKDGENNLHLPIHTNKLAEHTALVLNIRGSDQPLLVIPRRDMTIGRVAKGSSAYPDIDLSPYEAEKLGVSRLHAMLKREENTLVMIDLNSLNQTHINGQRLFPNERRVLRDGDQVRMGEMVMDVIFKD